MRGGGDGLMKVKHTAEESSAGSCIDGGQSASFESKNLSKASRFAKHQLCQSQYVRCQIAKHVQASERALPVNC